MNKFKRISLVFALTVMHLSFHAVDITIHNETPRKIFAATYYYSKDATKVGNTVSIEPGMTTSIEQPDFKFFQNRELVFDFTPYTLKETIKRNEFKNLESINIGLPGHYYINEEQGRLKGYTFTEWKLFKPAKETIKKIPQLFTDPVKQQIIENQPAIIENPYSQTMAKARISMDLHPEEIKYRNIRKIKVKSALEKLLQRNLNEKYIPEISFVMSGGGYRAMLFSSGFLTAAQELNLFDTFMYQVGLSGSTWAMNYLINAYKDRGLTIKQASQELAQTITKGLAEITSHEAKLISNALLVKSAFDQPISSVDLFGLLLGNRLFSNYKDKRHMIYLSDQADIIKKADWPLPIYTAVAAESTKSEKQYMYEFSPFEVWAPYGIGIPPFALGDKFSNGHRLTRGWAELGIKPNAPNLDNLKPFYSPAQPLGILLGTFGSAYAITLKRLASEIEPSVESPTIKTLINTITSPLKKMPFPKDAQKALQGIKKDIEQLRISSETFLNFTTGIKESPIKNNKLMHMADAGLFMGIPFPPVAKTNNRRKPDVYIIIDSAYSVKDAEELRKVENYAKSKNIPFPKINYTDIDKKEMSIFKEENPNIPIVIYFPRITSIQSWNKHKNQTKYLEYQKYLDNFDIEKCTEMGPCTTFNLKYDLHTAEQVQKLAEFNLSINIEKIKNVINELINKKSK